MFCKQRKREEKRKAWNNKNTSVTYVVTENYTDEKVPEETEQFSLWHRAQTFHWVVQKDYKLNPKYLKFINAKSIEKTLFKCSPSQSIVFRHPSGRNSMAVAQMFWFDANYLHNLDASRYVPEYVSVHVSVVEIGGNRMEPSLMNTIDYTVTPSSAYYLIGEVFFEIIGSIPKVPEHPGRKRRYTRKSSFSQVFQTVWLLRRNFAILGIRPSCSNTYINRTKGRAAPFLKAVSSRVGIEVYDSRVELMRLGCGILPDNCMLWFRELFLIS